MKRIISLVLAAVLALTCLSGCSEGGKPIADGKEEGEKLVADGKKVIDPFEGLTINFGSDRDHKSQKNGCGTIAYYYDLDDQCFDVDKVNYDKANSDIKKFLKDIKFTWVEKDEMNDRLKNGDTVHIALEYSKSDAKALGIQVLEETKEYTVSGLVDIYRNESEVDKAVLDRAYQIANQTDLETLDNILHIKFYMEEDVWDNFTYDISTRTFYEYKEDGNGEEYIHNFILMVTLNCVGDFDGTHFEGPGIFLRVLEIDASEGDYDWSLNPEGNKRASLIVLQEVFQEMRMSGETDLYTLTDAGKLVNESEYSKKIVEFTY